MATVNSIRDEFTEKFTEHIVSVDHNVPDSYDQEFSFHAICHPEIKSDGNPTVPNEIEEYVDDISKEHNISLNHMHVHFYIEVKDEILGIEERSEKDLQTVEKD